MNTDLHGLTRINTDGSGNKNRLYQHNKVVLIHYSCLNLASSLANSIICNELRLLLFEIVIRVNLSNPCSSASKKRNTLCYDK